MNTKPETLLKAAAAVLLLLSIARAAGGIFLIEQGCAGIPKCSAQGGDARIIGFGLLAVSFLGIAGSALAFRLHSKAIVVCTVGLIAFVLDGLINGTILFGQPTDGGTIANVLVASAIAILLYAGRSGLRGAA